MAAIYTHKSPFYKAAQDDECQAKSETRSIYAHNANVGKLSSLQNCDMMLLKLCFENHSLTCFKLFPKIENATSQHTFCSMLKDVHQRGAYEKISPFFALIQKAHKQVQELRPERCRMKFSYAAQALKFQDFVNF